MSGGGGGGVGNSEEVTYDYDNDGNVVQLGNVSDGDDDDDDDDDDYDDANPSMALSRRRRHNRKRPLRMLYQLMHLDTAQLTPNEYTAVQALRRRQHATTTARKKGKNGRTTHSPLPTFTRDATGNVRMILPSGWRSSNASLSTGDFAHGYQDGTGGTTTTTTTTNTVSREELLQQLLLAQDLRKRFQAHLLHAQAVLMIDHDDDEEQERAEGSPHVEEQEVAEEPHEEDTCANHAVAAITTTTTTTTTNNNNNNNDDTNITRADDATRCDQDGKVAASTSSAMDGTCTKNTKTTKRQQLQRILLQTRDDVCELVALQDAFDGEYALPTYDQYIDLWAEPSETDDQPDRPIDYVPYPGGCS